MKQLTIDNMHPGAIPIYSCKENSIPLVCQVQSKKDGSVESKAKKRDPYKYVAKLYKISSKTLLGIANMLKGMEHDKIDKIGRASCRERV